MGPRRRLIGGAALALLGATGWLAAPRRFVVDGVSMGPTLLTGDVVRTGVFPALDRLRPPRRFERRVLAATDGLAIKRVVGLPGEEISIVAGDLAIDGMVALKGPRLLAEMGSVVTAADAGPTQSADADWTWSWPGGELLDEADFDTGGPRSLAPVRDAGFAAVVALARATADPVIVRIRVGESVATRPLVGAGRHVLVAGRLDGHEVFTTWRLPAGATRDVRSCLWPGSPAAWAAAEPQRAGDGDGAPSLGLAVPGHVGATLEGCVVWRDVAYRVGADGRSSWRLGPEEVFVLGDHPAASTDSRRWGPLPSAVLRFRVAARVP